MNLPRGPQQPPRWRHALTITLCSAALLWAPGTLPFMLGCTEPDPSPAPLDGATAAVLQLQHRYAPRGRTIPTSEGGPYGDTDFWPGQDSVVTLHGYGPAPVQRLYICLSGMVPAEQCSAQPTPTGPLSPEMLSGIEQGIARFAGSGKRLLLRFVYNLGPVGAQARDAPLALVLQHIDQLAPILLRQQDLIFALQAGFVGTWGEWHSSTAGSADRASRQQIIDRLLQHFGGHVPVLLRYPGQMIEYLGQAVPTDQLGLHNDYFLSDSTDGGTWAGYNNPSVVDPALLQDFATQVAARTMFIAEFGALDDARQSCASLQTAALRYRLQSISLSIWPVEVAAVLQARGCLSSFLDRVGTRIELLASRVLISADGEARLELTLRNAGYGRVVRPRPVTLVLGDDQGEIARQPLALSQLDLRQLQPGQTAQTVVVRPGRLTGRAGGPLSANTVLSLWIPDPAPSLAPQAAYALPLNSIDEAGLDLFDPATGLNRLGRLAPAAGPATDQTVPR